MKHGLQWSNAALYVGAIVTLLCAIAVASAAEERKGTTDEELAQLELPRPDEVKVALLPFWNYAFKQEYTDNCRNSLIDLFAAEGFRIIHPALVAAVVSQDQTLEPGEAMRRGDAIRLGTSLGADWAVYGSITELEAYYKRSFFTKQRKAKVSMQLNVVDVAGGETIFWEQRRAITGGGHFSGGVFGKGRATLEREALHICSDLILQTLFGVLPEHSKVEPNPEAYAYLNEEEAKAAHDDAPREAGPALTYGQALLCASSGQDAEQVLADMVRFHDENADAHFWHGVAFLMLGNHDEAVSEWEAAVELDPDHGMAAQQLGVAEQP